MNMNLTINKKMKKIIVPIVAICIVIGILLIGINYNHYAQKLQANEEQKQADEVIKQKEKEKENVTAFIDNLNNDHISECVKLFKDSHIDANYKLDDGQTLYNKVVNIALEKTADTKNSPAKYFALFNEMKSTSDKNSIKLDTKNLNYNQVYLLNFIDIKTSDSKNESSNTNSSNTQINNSTKPKTQNFNMNGLELLEHSSSKDGYYITGKIKNNNNFNCSYVEVQAKITNNNGDVLDTPIANVTSLKNGETWSFKIPVIIDTSSPYKYQIINMKCNP